jgi:hypothetical protein
MLSPGEFLVLDESARHIIITHNPFTGRELGIVKTISSQELGLTRTDIYNTIIYPLTEENKLLKEEIKKLKSVSRQNRLAKDHLRVEKKRFKLLKETVELVNDESIGSN